MIIHPTKIKTFDQVSIYIYQFVCQSERRNSLFAQLKTEVTKKVGLPTGPVLKVFSNDHKQVKTLEEFLDGEKYICCGAEKLNLDACMCFTLLNLLILITSLI